MQPVSGYLLFVAVLCYPAAAKHIDLEITIHLCDYFGMEPWVRTHAQHSTEAILLQAGIIIHWQDCPLSPKTAVAQACDAATLGVTHFVVGALPESMSAKIATGPGQFGKSAMGRAGGFPTQAYIWGPGSQFRGGHEDLANNSVRMITAHGVYAGKRSF